MKSSNLLRLVGLLCGLASFASASPLSITGSATFVGGANGTWTFQYNSSAVGLTLDSIVIDLSPTDLRFDTAAGGFGSLSYLDIGGFGGTDLTTGLSGISATGAALDGGTLLTFNFTNFTSGSVFQFTGDVDHPDPSLVALTDCTGKTGLALTACNLANAGRTATNDARLLTAQTVGPNQMAGALVTFNFGGSGYEGANATGKFQGFSLGNGLASNANVSTPEPASLATLGTGLGFLLAFAARRRRA